METNTKNRRSVHLRSATQHLDADEEAGQPTTEAGRGGGSGEGVEGEVAEKESFACTQCTKVFNRRENLSRHWKNRKLMLMFALF